MILKNYWEKAVSFKEYMEIAKQRLENPKNDAEKEFHEYYELGVHRMERTLKTFKIDEILEQNVLPLFWGTFCVFSFCLCNCDRHVL